MTISAVMSQFRADRLSIRIMNYQGLTDDQWQIVLAATLVNPPRGRWRLIVIYDRPATERSFLRGRAAANGLTAGDVDAIRDALPEGLARWQVIEAMIEAGCTGKQIAACLGVSPSMVSRIVKGSRN